MEFSGVRDLILVDPLGRIVFRINHPKIGIVMMRVGSFCYQWAVKSSGPFTRRVIWSGGMMGCLSLGLAWSGAIATEKPDDPTMVEADAETPHDPAAAVDAIDVFDESLELTLFASEPMLFSPSDIDVDAYGRVWVCEIVNYRHFRNKENEPRSQGDRILILEDTDHDGKADQSTVFYQGTDIDSPHGICVLDNRVLVSANGHIFAFYDDNGDLKADRKEVLFSGFAGAQHDHGIHAAIFAPDGKLYFNFGNESTEVRNADGQIVVDRSGREAKSGQGSYQQGMIFRCDLDGSHLETVAWNFRNPWELCVDQTGNIWQSDNDDDGNRGTRINFVMEFGNYGFYDEKTKEPWRVNRTNLEEEIPDRHWHQNDPGVVPNLLLTGAGSPCGIMWYSGDLLPEKYRNQLIHCDPGPNMLRLYRPSRDGAGYSATQEVILQGLRDQWFRPVDVCSAPDGSLIIADWYDPGVGGHRMRDIQMGRLFRLAPKGHRYAPQKPKLADARGAVEALLNPNPATRFLGWKALMKFGTASAQALEYAMKDASVLEKCQLMWALSQLPTDNQDGPDLLAWKRHAINEMVETGNVDLVTTAIRINRRSMIEDQVMLLEEIPAQVMTSAAVARELLISLRDFVQTKSISHEQACSVLETYASMMLPFDRWLTEAFGIAAEGLWEEFLPAYVEKQSQHKPTSNSQMSSSLKELIWRSRAAKTPEYLFSIIRDPATSVRELPRYFRSLDFVDLNGYEQELAQLAFESHVGDQERGNLILTESVKRLSDFKLEDHPEYRQLVMSRVETLDDDRARLTVIEQFGLISMMDDVFSIMGRHSQDQLGVDAAEYVLKTLKPAEILTFLKQADEAQSVRFLEALTVARSPRMIPVSQQILKSDEWTSDQKRGAIRAIGKFEAGWRALCEDVEQGVIGEELAATIAPVLHSANIFEIKEIAEKYYQQPPSKNAKPLPSIHDLTSRRGNVASGRLLFHTTATCGKCHVVEGIGKEVGPDLSEIGSKLSRDAMYESILYPSAGISHGYESYSLLTTQGLQEVGILVNETQAGMTLKTSEGFLKTIPTDEIEFKQKQEVSLMPADLQKLMTEQELVDVVEFMQSLTRKKK